MCFTPIPPPIGMAVIVISHVEFSFLMEFPKSYVNRMVQTVSTTKMTYTAVFSNHGSCGKDM